VVKRAIRSAAIEFCRGSQIVQEIATTNATANRGEYDVESPTQMQLDRVLQIFYNTTELVLVPTLEVRSALAMRGSVSGIDPVYNTPTTAYFKTPSGSTFSVYPIPAEDAANAFTVKASFAPTRAASQLPDILFDDWVEGIAAGAIAILQSTPAQSYTSPTAGTYRMVFNDAMLRARSEARKGRVMASTRAKPVVFA
jgi:hypothetical protein